MVLRSKSLGCTEYEVQPTGLQPLIEVILLVLTTNTSLLKINEAELHECGEFEMVPLGHRVVIRVITTQPLGWGGFRVTHPHMLPQVVKGDQKGPQGITHRVR
jgi:hypothetical protein